MTAIGARSRRALQVFQSSLNSRVSALLFGQLAAAAGGMLMNLISTRALPPEGRGTLAFFLQVAFVAQAVAMLGRDRSFIVRQRFSGESPALGNFLKLNIAAIGCLLALSVVSWIRGGFANWDEGALWGTTLLYSAIGIFGFALRVSLILSERNSRQLYLYSALLVQVSLIAMGLLLLILDVSNVIVWLAVYPLSGLIFLACSLWGTLRRGFRSNQMDVEQVSSIRREGFTLLPLAGITILIQKSDRLLLPMLASAGELGRYVFVAAMMELIAWPIAQWTDTKIGSWRQISSEGERIPILNIFGRVTLVGVALGASVSMFAFLYIELFLPSTYASASLLIIPLGTAAILKMLTQVGSGILVALGKHRRATFAASSGLASSCLLIVALTPENGGLGTSVALVLGGIVSLAITIWSLKSTPRMSPFSDDEQLLRAHNI